MGFNWDNPLPSYYGPYSLRRNSVLLSRLIRRTGLEGRRMPLIWCDLRVWSVATGTEVG